MKLLDLELMLISIRAQAGASANPDIRFYIPRNEETIAKVKYQGDKDAGAFIDLDIDTSEEVSRHKIETICRGTVQQQGDYTIPLIITPFYS